MLFYLSICSYGSRPLRMFIFFNSSNQLIKCIGTWNLVLIRKYLAAQVADVADRTTQVMPNALLKHGQIQRCLWAAKYSFPSTKHFSHTLKSTFSFPYKQIQTLTSTGFLWCMSVLHLLQFFIPHSVLIVLYFSSYLQYVVFWLTFK